MTESKTSESTWQDVVGLVGISLAVAGLWDIPPAIQLVCLAGGVVCLLISFTNQSNWPIWMRWLLSVLAVVLIALMSWPDIKNL